MKIIILVFCLIAGCLANTAIKEEQVNATGTLCKLPNPYKVEGPIAANVTVYPILKLLEGSYIGNLIAHGLNKLRYDVKYNPLLLTVSFELSLDHADVYADFIAEGYLDSSPFSFETIPSGMFIGTGRGKISTDNFHMNGTATLEVNIIKKYVTVSSLHIEDISFGTMNIYLGDKFKIGWGNVNWEELRSSLKINFDNDWANHQDEITEKIRLATNHIAEKHTSNKFFEVIGFLLRNGKECTPKTTSEILAKFFADILIEVIELC